MKLKKNKSLTAFANENKIVYKHIKDSAILLKRMCTEVDCKECPFSFYGSCKFYDKETNLKELIKLIDERKEDVYHPSKMDDIAKILGVRLYSKLKIVTRDNDVVTGYINELGLHLEGLNAINYDFINKLLSDLLTGGAYIASEELCQDD